MVLQFIRKKKRLCNFILRKRILQLKKKKTKCFNLLKKYFKFYFIYRLEKSKNKNKM